MIVPLGPASIGVALWRVLVQALGFTREPSCVATLNTVLRRWVGRR